MSESPVKTGWAVVMHITGLIGSLIVPIIGLIVLVGLWAANKKDLFVDWHGREAIRFQLFMWLYSLLFVLMFLPFYFLVIAGATMITETETSTISSFVAVGDFVAFGGIAFFVVSFIGITLFALITPIIAAIKAGDGKYFVYPFTFSPRRGKTTQICCGGGMGDSY